MEQKLFSDSEVFQKERPTKLTDKQVDDFYLERAKDLIENGYSKDYVEDIIEDLKELYPFRDNGFEMANELKSYKMKACYEIDTQFCEWLDCLSFEYDQILTKNVIDWVKAHNPQPKFEKGTKLLITEHLCYGKPKGAIVYVTGGRKEEACYWIDENPNKDGGTVIEYELVEKCCVIAE